MKTIRVKIKDGLIVDGADWFQSLLNSIEGTAYITIEPISILHTEDDYRRVYFLFRDVLWQSDSRGYSKREFHNVLKTACLSELLSSDENFNCPPTLSVKCLSLIGWSRFLNNVKEFSKNEFNIFL